MNVTIGPRGVLQIDDARICFRNFRGEKGQYNDEGDRSFSIIIPDMETAEMLQNDLNRYGVGWNVKINPPREDGAAPFIHLPVKINFNDRGPRVYLESGNNKKRLTESTIEMLDFISISSVDLTVRPYDSEVRGNYYRTAYLDAIWVTQEVDRFEARMAEEEYPEED